MCSRKQTISQSSQAVPRHISFSTLCQILDTHHPLCPLLRAHNNETLCIAAVCLLHGTVCLSVSQDIFVVRLMHLLLARYMASPCTGVSESRAARFRGWQPRASGKYISQSRHRTLKTHFMRLDSRTRSTDRPCRRSLEATSAAPDCNEASMATTRSSTWHTQVVVGELPCALRLQTLEDGYPALSRTVQRHGLLQ